MRKEGRLLEHDADAAILRRTPLPRGDVAPDFLSEPDRAGVRPFEPGNLPDKVILGFELNDRLFTAEDCQAPS